MHTAFGSPCAELHRPDTLLDTLKHGTVHGIVITEHNLMWPRQNIEALNRCLPANLRIYSGIEVSTSAFHVVVIGLDDDRGIFSGIRHEKLLDITRKSRAVTILVHPLSGIRNPDIPSVYPDTDCIEVASTTTFGEALRRTCELCTLKKAIPVAGSDAHCRENIGKTYTAFPHLPGNEHELAELIRQGLGVPMVRESNGKGVRAC